MSRSPFADDLRVCGEYSPDEKLMCVLANEHEGPHGWDDHVTLRLHRLDAMELEHAVTMYADNEWAEMMVAQIQEALAKGSG